MAERAGGPLDRLYRAGSVAVIGAVAPGGHGRLGSKPVEYLRRYGFPGPVYPINPNHREIAGFPCYPSIGEVPGPVDTALLLRRQGLVLETLTECLAAGVRTAVVTAGGYGEAGPGGVDAERRLGAFARESGLRLAGPNCNGFIAARERLTLGFHPFLEDGPLLAGPVGIVSQSGSFVSSVLRRLTTAGVGVSYALSCGNEVDITAADNLDFLVADASTSVVLLFLESARQPGRFLAAARRARATGTRIIALKVGRSAQGAQASASHTGALVGSDADYRAMFDHAGIIGVDTAEELVATAHALVSDVRLSANRVGVVSMSGGVNALVADRAARFDLVLPEVGAAASDELRALLPIGTPMNPLDLTGVGVDNPDTFGAVLRIMDGQDQFDCLLLVWGLLPDEAAVRWVRTCIEHRHSARRPVVVYAVAGQLPHAAELNQAGIPVFTELEAVLGALRNVSGRPELSVRRPVGTLGGAAPGGRIELSELLAARGIRVAAEVTVPIREGHGTADAAVLTARRLGYPVAVKVRSTDIPHRTAVGGVRLGVSGDEELRNAVEAVLDAAARQVPDAVLDGVDVQTMVSDDSFEVLVGATRGVFGPLIAVGAGGILAEVLSDVATALCPVAPEEALGLLRRLRAFPILERGLPGTGPLDVAELCRVVAAVSEIVAEYTDRLDELDLNPVLVHRVGRGVTVVDMLARWRAADEGSGDDVVAVVG